MFTPEKIRTHIARIEHERRESDTTTVEDDNELLSERPATATERARQFTSIKELLIAPELGAS
jgi:hypothetical protein